MTLLKKIALVSVLGFAVWAAWTYPKIGELSFTAGAAAEARVYGLSKQSADIGEMELVYYRGGRVDAPTIVMIHGYTADKDVWPRFARHFLDDYQVIIPDLAGHGDTVYLPQADYSIDAQSARVIALLDKLDIAKAHVIGNSMGGFTTAFIATHYPQRTLSATMIDPAGVKSPQPSDMENMLAQGENPFLVNDADDFANFYPMTMAQPPYLPGFVLDAMAHKYAERRERHDYIFSFLAKQLTAPALLIWGAKDRLIHVSATQVWAAGVEQLQVEIMDELGHMPMVEAPSVTAQRYQAFLSGL